MRAGALLGAAVLLVGAAGIGRLAGRDGGLLRVAQLLDHPLLFGGLAFVSAVAGICLAVRKTVVRWAVAGTAVLVLIPFTPLALLLLTTAGQEQTLDEAAPGRSDRRLVVTEGSAMIDPLWWVYVDSGSGLGVRRWQVAHINGDFSGALVEAAWDGPDRIRLVMSAAERETYIVELGPDGRPLRTVTKG
ncbi:hypothetical protein ACGFMM_31945 [Streptomyces sp. NPDC048604]|uniref:hypothetical protein n=1 Tax=Streptomyces sp. NPDC048604 TaxID=3365578 RepID=UPI003711C970